MSRVRTALVIIPAPSLDQPSRLGDRPEPVEVQALVSQRPVERLDIGIVGKQIFWRSALAHQPVEGIGDMLAAERGATSMARASDQEHDRRLRADHIEARVTSTVRWEIDGRRPS